MENIEPLIMIALSNYESYRPQNFTPIAGIQSKQQSLIKKMSAAIEFGHTYFTVEISKKATIEYKGGMQWLGLKDEDNFTLQQYLRMLYPTFELAHYYTAMRHIEKLGRGDFQDLEFGKPIASFIQSLRLNDGEIYIYKRQLYAFEFDTQKRVSKYLNFLYQIRKYDGKNVYSFIEGIEMDKVREETRANVERNIEDTSIFAPHLIKVLKAYIQHPLYSSAGIAEELELKPKTISDYNVEIIAIARRYYKQAFNTAREVAILLHFQNII